ncbi:MAG: cbb3-type cytochrome c oxidase subunit II, partial [Epsilonproteobacteria bacterium]|nr:cbb3-type cytochrome c oxidase subunit II [Campylobacterota bacterium]
GPDLHRVGNYRTTDWHENHMLDPQSVVPGSVMPKYDFMFNKSIDFDTAYAEAYTVKKVFNVPYDKPGMPKLGSHDEAKKAAYKEAGKIVADMKNQAVKDAYKNGDIKEIVALIAYLNSLK